MKTILHIFVLSLLFTFNAYAQRTEEVRDTLSASIKEASRFVNSGINGYQVRIGDVHNLISPIGEADIIKFIQVLPGVSMGAEGSSAAYIRGGNMGGTRITLDGVPVYGNTHLLGFTQSVPLEIMEDAHVRISGFPADEGDFTDAYISMTTQNRIANHFSGTFSVSPAFISSLAKVPIIKNRLSVIGSARWSPTAMIWNGFKLQDHISGVDLKDTKATVYDLFGKINWNISGKQRIFLSYFHSKDSYDYTWRQTQAEMSWQNSILNLKYHLDSQTGCLDAGLSWNRLYSQQGQTQSVQADNLLGMTNSLSEWSARFSASYPLIGADVFRIGLLFTQSSYLPNAYFSLTDGRRPGIHTSSFSGSSLYSRIGTLSVQWEKGKNNLYLIRTSGRLNLYQTDQTHDLSFHPEYDLTGRLYFLPGFGLEVSIDKRKQFHHLLDGLPTGWSLDLIVPSDESFLPEESIQYSSSLFFEKGALSLSVNAYSKSMKNLVCYRNAINLFSPSLAGWKSDVDVGSGTSRGIEILAECVHGENTLRIAYTLSKTDRQFPYINDGIAFPFQFDRTHILNVTGNGRLWHNDIFDFILSGLLTYQSGSWETLPEGVFHPWMFELQEGTKIEYYSGINNYRMPSYFRLDLGCTFSRTTKKCTQKLYLGVYNATNRHNPITLVYDIDEERWKQISLLPILPTIKYSISF